MAVDNTELARRLVACPRFRFRWMKGMRALSIFDEGHGKHEPPMLVVYVDPTGGLDGYGDDRQGFAGLSECNSAAKWLPDLDDPATLGCLLALVREAWGVADLRGVVNVSDLPSLENPAERWRVEIVRWNDLHRVYQSCVGETFSGATEAEALVCALEAAP